jgi:hypothetical protein
MNQRIEHLKDDDGQELLSHYRISTNKYGREIRVPVVDVRDGIAYRLMAMQMSRASGRSKYMNYNQYNQSRKQYR